MKVSIRTETLKDYNAIANLNYEAFLGWHPDNPYVTESLLVDYLRHNALFDPELSLVAQMETGEIVGHVLFTPYRFTVLGKEEPGVVLGPVAVKPEFQRKGIGGDLIEEGHRRAREKGYAFSLLCGHEEYYPRFGYKTRMFSLTGSKVEWDGGKIPAEPGFSHRPVKPRDLPFILEAWERQHGASPLALFPGSTISDWLNYGLECRCFVILNQDKVLGYVRYARSRPLFLKELLAEGKDIPAILSYLVALEPERVGKEIRMARRAQDLKGDLEAAGSLRVVSEEMAHEAFMIKILKPESLMAAYCHRLAEGTLQPGIIIFPSSFDPEDGRSE